VFDPRVFPKCLVRSLGIFAQTPPRWLGMGRFGWLVLGEPCEGSRRWAAQSPPLMCLYPALLPPFPNLSFPPQACSHCGCWSLLPLSKAGPLLSLALGLYHKERRSGSSSKTSRCKTRQQPWAVHVAPGPLVLVLPSTPGPPAGAQLLQTPIREWTMSAMAHMMPKMFLVEGAFSLP